MTTTDLRSPGAREGPRCRDVHMSPAVIGALAVSIAAGAAVLSFAARSGPGSVAIRHPDAGHLEASGLGWSLGRWEALRAGIVGMAWIATLGLELPWPMILAAGAVPSVWIRGRASAARDRARRAMTRLVSGTEAALRSGATLPEALRREANASADSLARDLVAGAIRAFDLGASLDAGLRSAALTARDPRMALVLETLGLAAEERLSSARAADLLAGLADRLAFEERLEDEVRARTSGARQQQTILALLVPAIAIVLIGSMPALATALDSAFGRFVLIPGAVALEVGGVLLARRIVNEALT